MAAFFGLAFSTAILALGSELFPYPILCVVAIAIQVGFAVLAFARFRRLLSICTLVIASWSVYFVARSVAIMVNTDPIHDHVSVVDASEALRSEVWVGTTAALGALVAGMLLSQRYASERSFRDPAQDPRGIFRVVAIACIATTAAAQLAGIQSGILDNALKLYLFCIAALIYEATRRGQIAVIDVLIVSAAILLGPFLNFKEPAVMAIFAVVVGHLAAGKRANVRFLVLSALAGILVFTGVQAQRITFEQTGATTGAAGLPRNIIVGLTQYDLARGGLQEQSGIDLLTNPLNGVLLRARGTDAFFALRSKLPEQVPYQAGKSIIQPILVTIPIVGDVLDLEFTQLSLGRYYNYNFWTYRPEEDSSSQALTTPGDLFLNGGWPGVLAGLAILGAAIGWLDRRFPARSAVGAGLFAYALLPLISLERGVAYQIVTVGIRLTIALLFIKFIGGKSSGADRDSESDTVQERNDVTVFSSH